MGTVYCPGGHSFSDGEIPSPHEWTLISDEKVGDVIEEIRVLVEQKASVELVGDTWSFLLRSHGKPTYICPECARLLVFEHGLDKPAKSYKPE